jgi:septal ring factor EnvC (AmiA/AmiB activator)
VKAKGFGAPDAVGGTEKGITIATRPGAGDGAVRWVGGLCGTLSPYGQLLILNAGGGYHVLVAGMEQSPSMSAIVLTGEPGRDGSGARRRHRGGRFRSPALYVEFRKTGHQSIPVHGGQQTTTKRFADDAQTVLVLLGAAAGAGSPHS